MKTRFSATIAAFLASAGLMFAATNDLTSLIQKGLFEEEANHNIEAAMRAYQAAVDGIDKDRQLDATAVFRLGECWRKLGKTNEASLQYQRVLREFPEQTNLTKLCSEYLGGARATIPSEAAPDAKSQEVQASYNNLKLKWTLAESELGAVTNMAMPDLIKYFTTIKPDNSLLASLSDMAKGHASLNELAGSGLGPQQPAIKAAEANLQALDRDIAMRVDTLVWSLKKEAEMLHAQGDALRKLLDQSKPFAPDLATSTTTTPSAEDEEVRKIKEMIQNSPDLINGPGPGGGGKSPLKSAVYGGNVAAAELLLANGADPNGTGQEGETPLGMATDRGNKAMIELLLAKDANVNIADKGDPGLTPLHHAAQRGFKTVVEFLLAHKADVNVRSTSGSTPLTEAAANGFRNVAELLLASHADVNARDKESWTPLYEAVRKDHPEIVQLLLANKANVNAADNQGETPLFVAIRNNQPEIVKLLLANKADVNIALKSGLTPLLLAGSKRDIDLGIVRSLLQNGADVQAYLTSDPNGFAINSKGSHALDFAIKTGRTNILELLLASHADPNATSPGSVGVSQGLITPLIWTELNSFANAEESFEILLDHKADPDLADSTGKTPLIYAMMRGNVSAVQGLLDHHADVNKPDNQGQPPLAYLPHDNAPPQSAMPGPAPSPPASRSVRGPGGADRQQAIAAIKALLLKAGANEDYQRLGRIFLTQKGTGSIGEEIFHKDANSFNHYTLFELIAEAYKPVGLSPGPMEIAFRASTVFFPDLAHITINRLKSGGTKEEISVNLDEIIKSADCSKDPVLEWGDIVQIPQLDHLVNEYWNGLTDDVKKNLANCLTRKVEIVVKGQTTNLTLVTPISRKGGMELFANRLVRAPTPQNLPAEPFSLSTFSLNEVVHGANVLLLSSDLSRVKVTRNAKSMTFDLETGSSSDLWLRDGDVIEIPERDTDAPATK